MEGSVVGIISDTHGVLRPEAAAALAGSRLIVHAGDVGRQEVLRKLEDIAPVYAVRGNVDGPWAQDLPETRLVDAGKVRLFVIHDVKQLRLDRVARGIHAVISGHSHKPSQTVRNGVLYLNPGSAGPRRFRLPVTVARLHIQGSAVEPEIVMLPV